MQVSTESLPLRTYLCYGFQKLRHRMLHCRIVHFHGMESGHMRSFHGILYLSYDNPLFIGNLIHDHGRPRNKNNSTTRAQ